MTGGWSAGSVIVRAFNRIPQSNGFELFVRIPSRNYTIKLLAKATNSVDDVKGMIQGKERLFKDQQRLMFTGRDATGKAQTGVQLEDSRTLSSHGIGNEMTIVLLVRGRGGAGRCVKQTAAKEKKANKADDQKEYMIMKFQKVLGQINMCGEIDPAITVKVRHLVDDINAKVAGGVAVIADAVGSMKNADTLRGMQSVMHSGGGNGTTEDMICGLSQYFMKDAWDTVQRHSEIVSLHKNSLKSAMILCYSQEFLIGGKFENSRFRKLIDNRLLFLGGVAVGQSTAAPSGEIVPVGVIQPAGGRATDMDI